MMRRLVAVLPCRCNSTRLWGKPLQRLAPDLAICEYLVFTLQQAKCVSEVRLAIAEGPGDEALVDLAERLGLAWLVGSEEDVLGRVIACAHEAGASDVVRKTSEDPFLSISLLEAAWCNHVEHGNEITALDLLPAGTAFEIFSLAALERCHELGDAEDREHIANYARFHQAQFALEIMHPEAPNQRMDLRLTVDNPEDLILCRAVYSALFRGGAPVAVEEIIEFLDTRPDLVELVRPFVDEQAVWVSVAQRESHV